MPIKIPLKYNPEKIKEFFEKIIDRFLKIIGHLLDAFAATG